MHILNLRLLALQVIIGLASGAALSPIAADSNPDLISARHPEPQPVDTPVFTPLTPRDPDPAPELLFPVRRARNKKTTAQPAPTTSTTTTTGGAPFTTNAAPGEDNYCGESNSAIQEFGPTTPLISDCKLISARYNPPVRGYWTVTPAADGGWVTLASQGTCAFKVQLHPTETATTFRYGTNDVRFFINLFVQYAQGGHYQGVSNALCVWAGNARIVKWAIAPPGYN